MTEPFERDWNQSGGWPEWGADPPPRPAYEKHYVTGPHGDHHAGEVLDVVHGADVERPGETREYQILRCHPCCLIHAWPLPAPAALAAYYAREFYQRDKPDYVARYEQDRAWGEGCVHGPILQACLRYAPQTKTMLDIGAGPGIALDVGKAFGLETFGIEPNPDLCMVLERDRGHKMMADSLETVAERRLHHHGPPLAPWDLLYLYEVLEHQPNPEDFLLRCWDLLAAGGLLVVAVPNDYNSLQLAACARLGVQPYWLAPPQHLTMFTPKTLQLLLRRCGYAIVDTRATFPMEKFLFEDGRCYIGNNLIGRACHAERMAYELEAVRTGRWQQLEQEYRSNVALRIGRELVFIGIKID